MSEFRANVDRAWIKLNAALNELFDAARAAAVNEGTVVSLRVETDRDGKPKNGIARAVVSGKKWRAIVRWEREP